jgi:hypothetical protein
LPGSPSVPATAPDAPVIAPGSNAPAPLGIPETLPAPVKEPGN